MISRIDHVSIAVNDYEKALHFFQNIFGAIPGAGDTNRQMKYHWQILSLGDLSRLELIHPTEKETFFGVLIQIAQFNPDDWLDKSVIAPKGKKWSVIQRKAGCTLTLAHPGGGKVKLELTPADIKALIGELEQCC